MTATTTIRLPPELRARINVLAKQTGRSAHSLIVEAVERHVAYEEQMRSLVEEAVAGDAYIERTGEVYRAEDVQPSGYEPDELPGCSTPREVWCREWPERMRNVVV